MHRALRAFWAKTFYEAGKLSDRAEFVEAIVVGRWGIDAFVLPGEAVGDVDCVPAEVEDGEAVGFDRVSDHEEFFGGDVVALEDAGVVFDLFVGDDFDVIEAMGETGAGYFALLVPEVTFCDEDEVVGS